MGRENLGGNFLISNGQRNSEKPVWSLAFYGLVLKKLKLGESKLAKLTVDEALKILATTDSYYLKRDIRKFLKKRGVEIPESS